MTLDEAKCLAAELITRDGPGTWLTDERREAIRIVLAALDKPAGTMTDGEKDLFRATFAVLSCEAVLTPFGRAEQAANVVEHARALAASGPDDRSAVAMLREALK